MGSERDRRRRGFRATGTGYRLLTEARLALPQVDGRSGATERDEIVERMEEEEGERRTGRENRADDRLAVDDARGRSNLPRDRVGNLGAEAGAERYPCEAAGAMRRK